MTTFSYSSGNPGNLTGGHSASMSDISGPLVDIPTFLNGNITDTNITPNSLTAASLAADSVGSSEIAAGAVGVSELATAVKPATLKGEYRTITEAQGIYIGTLVAGNYSMAPNAMNPSGGGGNGSFVFPVVPTDYAISGLTAQFRVRGVVASNSTSPACNFTFGMYPISAVSGSAGQFLTTLGTVVPGSTAAAGNPGAAAGAFAVGADFTPPASGLYCLGVLTSGTIATNSNGIVYIRLEVHHV